MIRFKTAALGQVTIKFRHLLPSVEVPHQNNSLSAILSGIRIKQGKTTCHLMIDGDKMFGDYQGYAYVHPDDQYKKETGRELSLKRAIEAADLSKNLGREILVGYYSRGVTVASANAGHMAVS